MSQNRHRSYSATTAQPPPYSLAPSSFCPPPPPPARPRKHSAPTRARASTSSRSAPTTPPAYDEHPPSSSSRLRPRHRTASAEFGANLFLTPATPRLGARSAPQLAAHVPPHAHALYRPPAYGSYFDLPGSDDEGDDDDDSLIYPTFGSAPVPRTTTTAMSKTPSSLRARLFGAGSHAAKSISTTPGVLGAGETETEADEPVSTAFSPFFDRRVFFFSSPIVPVARYRLSPLLHSSRRHTLPIALSPLPNATHRHAPH